MSASFRSKSPNSRQKLLRALELLDEFIAEDESDELFFENRFVRWQQASLVVHDAKIAADLIRRYFVKPPLPTAQEETSEVAA